MPPKNLFKVYGIIAGVVLVAIVATVMLVIGTGGKPATNPAPSRGDLVRVQVRSFPAGELIHLGNHLEGKTPKMILVPRSNEPITLTVQFGLDTVVKSVVPVDDMVVDFRPHE